MPAKRIAAMGRSYRCPQADRHDCLQFAARQRSVEDGAAAPTEALQTCSGSQEPVDMPALASPLPPESSMAKLRLYLRLLHLLAIIGLVTLLAGVVSLLERLRRRDLMGLRQRMSRWFFARMSNALPFRLSVHGELPQEPMLWVSNHISWTDIPLLGMLAPLSFLSKAEVRSWPLAGWLAHQAGTLFIRRGAGDSSLLNQQLGHHLGQGRPLLIFPEGTTTDGQVLRTFHGRLLSSAIESGAALQPVAIRSEERRVGKEGRS